jgi:hypothetical protein
MDRIFESWLARQLVEGRALEAQSDLFDLVPAEESPAPRRYVVCYHCTGLVRDAGGEVREANQFAAGIWFPDDYLRHVEPFQVMTWLAPRQVFHPNISDRAPFICVGRIGPGTPLVDLIYQVHEIITFNKATVSEFDALNRDACAWSRANQHRLPVDRRPLKRRAPEFDVEIIGAPE